MDIDTNFVSIGGTDCPIVSVGLYKDDKGTEEYEDTIMKITENKTLIVSPKQKEGRHEAYAVARTQAGILSSIKIDLTLTREPIEDGSAVFSSLTNR